MFHKLPSSQYTHTTYYLKTLKRKTSSFLILLSLQIKKLEKYAYAVKIYYKSRKREAGSKTVYFKFPDQYLYNRYYYILGKYFLIEGYTVFINMDLMTLFNFSTDPISYRLLEEEKVIFGPPPADTLELKNFNRAYFGPHKDNGNTYYVPIGQHPGMYFGGYWKDTFDVDKRKNSIFFAGNFQEGNYAQTINDKVFGVHNRLSVYDFLTKKELITEKNTEPELEDYIASEEDKKFILVNIGKGYKIHYSKVRYYNSHFDFMFAFPGVLMPLCHNITEAMSVGTIPFIQSAYAAVVQPPLIDDQTCVTFDDLEDLESKIEYLLAMPQSKIDQLRENVQHYHATHMTPAAIVKALESQHHDQVSLLAEYHSVCLLL